MSKKTASENADFSDSKTGVRLEQRYVVHYYYKRGKSATKCLEKLRKVYGDQTLCRRQVFKLYKEFVDGRETAARTPPSGRHVSASTDVIVNTISALLAEDNSLTQRQIAGILDISQSTVHRILVNVLKM